MNPLIKEWVAKAEGDYNSLGRELRARKSPNYDAACFHAQQCVEKYLKACLQDSAIRFDKTHNLVALLDHIAPMHSEWELFRADFQTLSLSAVNIRYPGVTADRVLARQAAMVCRRFRESAQLFLGLPSEHTRSPSTQRPMPLKHSKPRRRRPPP